MTGKTMMTLAALVLAAAPAAAQVPASPFSLEVRGRAAYPTGDFGEEDETGSGVETGWGGSVAGHFQVTPVLSVYGGYSFTRFPTDLGDLEAELEALGIDDASIDIDDTGFDAGLRAMVPAGGGSAFLRGGLVYHRADVQLSDDLEDAIGGILDPDELDSDWSLGWQAGAGLLLPLGPRLSASLGASYTSYEPRFGDDSGEFEVSGESDLTYASIEVGLEFRP
ncbi:outer membrane beta-barrel protein [Longimicrobium sp.]|uniref:outer membrane beta-barrel protein n=1 Tax=Longimicrobium sp. TaxID=2029185 RepID=UPI002E342B5E|nr:outer membrane beta-barrel protein [Longimicrobium sp.]HEX6041404.1 outer membrane beta-barrel protein [Longimicrobium sp.]